MEDLEMNGFQSEGDALKLDLSKLADTQGDLLLMGVVVTGKSHMATALGGSLQMRV